MSDTSSIGRVRHSLSHVMAMAVLQQFPDAKLAIGPAIDTGFYYDFELPQALGADDLPKLQKAMQKIVNQGISFEHSTVSLDEARTLFAQQPYKLELIEELAAAGEETVSLYTSGDFVDLCKGPHVEDGGELKAAAFKLDTVAGAYWRGDESKAMLTRIYGLAFATKEELQAYLDQRAEAEKRDHRKLGKTLDLFVFSDLVGPGLPLWTPKGMLLRTILDDYVWELRSARGYHKVEIPHITKKDLYETSGHWQKFADELFRIKTREDHEFALKPMNCPHHTQIFDRHPHSYRDMPQRYANTTMVYRDEQTGELSGLSRVRCITQDDAHVFCRQGQVKEEFLAIWDIVDTFYKAVGFEELAVELSLHDPENFAAYLGTPQEWQAAEEQIRQLATERGVAFVENPGEAAFYGPKVDFIAKDSLGRTWQVATIQLDMNMPERFDLHCINEQGDKERVVMIHAAIMGSLERFLSIIIEHHAGAFPVWMAPVQVRLATVSEAHSAFAQQLADTLRAAGLRAEVDDSDETVGKKIRNAEQQKLPYTLVIGDKEAGGGPLAVRVRGQQDMVEYSQADFIAHVQQQMADKTS